MAGIESMSGVSSAVPRTLPEPSTSRRLAPGPRDPRPALAPKQEGDLLLIKTVLDRKDFQLARMEVDQLACQQGAGDASGPPAAPAAQPPSGTVTVETVELNATTIHIESESQGNSLQLDFTNLQLHVHRETTATARQAKDPLVLDLDGQGPRTTGNEGARAFDLGADGTSAPTSFVTGGSAFLALDRNGNGRIDDGGELFGDQHGAADGYEELRKFDANADGSINAEDPVFGRLQLLYGSGATTGLADAGIRSIQIDASPGTGTASGGDAILRASTAQREDGSTLATYALLLNTFDTTV
jgi:hypothetical protein